jgi:hypothetical protein
VSGSERTSGSVIADQRDCHTGAIVEHGRTRRKWFVRSRCLCDNVLPCAVATYCRGGSRSSRTVRRCGSNSGHAVTSGLPLPTTPFERSRWRGGRFACYAPHVMPQRNALNCGSRTCSFSKYRKTNSLQMGEKIEFP